LHTAIYTVHVKQSPVAVCNTWEDAEPALLTIALESTVGAIRTFVLNFSKLPRGGSFTISYVWATGGKIGVTEAIAIDSLDATNIIAAFQRGTNWNNIWFIACTKRSPLEYSISIWLSAFPVPAPVISSMSIANSNIVNFSTKVGLLSLNTMEVEALLAGQSSVDAVMEVEVELAGERLTIVQAQSYIVNDLIDTDVYELVQFGDVIPADSVVRYDTSQSLTTGQKLQARNNIGALGASSLDALVAKDAELELLISGGSLSTAELEAIQGAATPSATNLFLTRSASDALYATLVHQHLPADIVGLQSTLDSQNTNIGLLTIDIANLQTTKAAVYHTQPTSTITGLDTILAGYDTRINGFAAFNHTHTTLQVDGLEGRLATLELFQTNKEANVPTAGQKAALDYANAPSDINPLVTESRVATLLANNITGFATQVYVNLQLNAAINLLPEQYLSLGIEVPTGAPTNLTNVYFPRELLITQDGVSYYVPARLA